MFEEVQRTALDDRPIQKLVAPDFAATFFVGEKYPGWHECDEIRPYSEHGEMEYVTWFAIYKNGEITHRVAGKNVLVKYKETKNE